MCTAIAYNKKEGMYFGRNLDYEHGFEEKVVITPRGYEFNFGNDLNRGGLAIIGTATVIDGYPLYFDAMNEKGVCIAGLNFVGNSVYFKKKDKMHNPTCYEFIPWLLSNCKSVGEMRELLKSTNIIDKAFNSDLPTAQLHWLAADEGECIVIESTKDGLNIYDNDIGVLTNNPPFPIQRFSLRDYMKLSPENPQDVKWGEADLTAYSRGMGGIGLPGDLSSRSRFIRGAFMKTHSVSEGEQENVNQVFHILDSVKQIKGCCITETGEFEYTLYSCCFDTSKKIYYVTTFENREIRAFDMNSVNLSTKELYLYPFYSRKCIELNKSLCYNGSK